jgi:hypothetical protein
MQVMNFIKIDNLLLNLFNNKLLILINNELFKLY